MQTHDNIRPRFNAVNRGFYIADNYALLQRLNSESIDLVNIDPPFQKNETFAGDQLKPPLSQAELDEEMRLLRRWGINDQAGAEVNGIQWPGDASVKGGYTDTWSWEIDVRPDWLDVLDPSITSLIDTAQQVADESTAAYLCYMAVRLIEIRRVLKPSGSVYLHCDHAANAYLRLLMDAVFGRECFRNEVAWCYTGPSNPRRWYPRKHDSILFYGKTSGNKFNRDAARIDYKRLNTQTGGGGIGGRLSADDVGQYMARGKVAEDYWFEDRDDMSPVGRSPGERTGYPTQKPWKLAQRIIAVSSDPGDVVLDCFAGSGYTAIAAERVGRDWIACDITPRAWTAFKRQLGRSDAVGSQPVMVSASVVTVHGPGDLPVRDS